MKLKLKGRYFESTEEMQAESQDVLKCWRKMTSSSASNHGNNAEGDYFKGEGGE
jgi:hypothetical protein